MKRLIIYGDIHGCYDEFFQLRNSLNIQNSDVEVCVGDFLTRGKDSINTLRYIQRENILSVMGNHEYKLVRYINHQKSTKENPIELDADENHIVENLNPTDISFLNNLPFFLKFGPITVMHGGIQNHQNLDLMTKKEKEQMLRLRYLDKNQRFVAFGEEDHNSTFWTDLYDGNQGFIVYGHQYFQEVNRSPHALGIDTGCVYGNKLSAVVFNNVNVDDYVIHSCDAKHKPKNRS